MRSSVRDAALTMEIPASPSHHGTPSRLQQEPNTTVSAPTDPGQHLKRLQSNPVHHPDPSSQDDADGEDDGDSLQDQEHPGQDLIDQETSPPTSVAENLPLSPLEDTQSYADFIKKMAARLGLSTAVPSPPVEPTHLKPLPFLCLRH